MELEASESIKSFLESAASILGWRDLNNEVVMDIGCGMGFGSTMFLYNLYPNLKAIIGIDQWAHIIKAAVENNFNEKISYYVADIADASTLTPWRRKISKIVCVDCLVWLRDQRIGFLNIYDLLRPGGSAAIMTGLNSPFPEAFKYMVNNTRWRDSPLGTESQFPRFPKRLELQDYYTMMREIGFEVVHIEEFYRTFRISKTDYSTREADFISMFLSLVPQDEKDNFKRDFRDAFKVVHGITSEENYRVKLKTAILFIRRRFFPLCPLKSTASTSRQILRNLHCL